MASFLSAGCTQNNDANQVEIQTIEATVQMPRDAHSLASYERYYARRPDGMIIGVYTNHDESQRRGVLETCANYRERPFPCPVGNEGVRLVQAGESLWLEDPMAFLP